MADRNERHFLEFYTPARQRTGGWRTARRHRMTPSSEDKENPSNHPGDSGAVPATIPGEKATGIGRQRRRLFTRSAGKSKRDDGDRVIHDLTSVHCASGGVELTSPPGPVSTVSRALFGADANVNIAATDTIDEDASTPNLDSPPGTSTLLKEYRSKQSLLSSSKARSSAFSSPIPGGLRLRSPSLWKIGKGDKKNGVKKYSDEAETISEIKTMGSKTFEASVVDSVSPTSLASYDNLPVEFKIDDAAETPPTEHVTPKATPKRYGFWSPPGTSRLLRKYRQRTQEFNQDPNSFQSPPPTKYDRSRTTPRGRRGLRLLDSGAKRCRNDRKALRPRPATNEAATPATMKARERVETGTKVKKSSTKVMNNMNRSLLSPSTAKRLDKDIQSYRHAHGRSVKTNTLVATAEESPLREETKRTEIIEDTSDASEREENTNFADNVDGGGIGKTLYPQFMPSLEASGNAEAEGHVADPTSNESVADSLPFDEHDVSSPVVNSDMPRSPDESSSMQAKNAEDEITNDSVSPVAITANPSDEDVTEAGVFQSTRSATRKRRQFLREAAEAVTPVQDSITDSKNNDELESGVFRSTRSATRARQKALAEAMEDSITVQETPVDSKRKEDKEEGIYRSTRSATRARQKALTEAMEARTPSELPAENSKEEKDEGRVSSGGSQQESFAVVTSENSDDGNDNQSGVFRSTRSSTRARRKSLLDARKAVNRADAAISGSYSLGTNSLVVNDAASGDKNSGSSAESKDGNNTPSSKGSLQSIWDALDCANNSIPSDDASSDSRVHRNIVSRVGDCVNPMASTLMNMWREEEEKAAADDQRAPNVSEERGVEAPLNSKISDSPSVTSPEEDGAVTTTFCGLHTPPPTKSFSSDLNLVYGLERVQNLTMARPKALQATQTTNVESLIQITKPFTSCTQ